MLPELSLFELMYVLPELMFVLPELTMLSPELELPLPAEPLSEVLEGLDGLVLLSIIGVLTALLAGGDVVPLSGSPVKVGLGVLAPLVDVEELMMLSMADGDELMEALGLI